MCNGKSGQTDTESSQILTEVLFSVGTEWDQYEKVYEMNWSFTNLEDKPLIDGNTGGLFCNSVKVIRAVPEDDLSLGRWVLAFKDEVSWRKAWLSSQDKIAHQCEVGARMGCSISATNACRLPWWKSVLVFFKAARVEEGELERCEEHEMRACMAASKENCLKYASETCEPVFAGMRIADSEQLIDPRFIGPFVRKQWTKDAMKNKVSSLEGDGVQDSKLAEGRRIMPDYRESFTVENEPARSRNQWEGATWSEDFVETESKSAGESMVDSWEGGLIRPKIVDQALVESGSVTAENVQSSYSGKH
ncbi:hypothetical protein R1flu_015540 [Riccia fluitans]|uniref:Uncharacterized protein n=1 Tax=Riccia fluitans TaxID=41844 RepID=A0ABD1YKA5_9MARC